MAGLRGFEPSNGELRIREPENSAQRLNPPVRGPLVHSDSRARQASGIVRKRLGFSCARLAFTAGPLPRMGRIGNAVDGAQALSMRETRQENGEMH